MEQTPISALLQTNNTYQVSGTLWIGCNGDRFLGPGRVELLERIETTGSISKAAKGMGMSYKKAWEMVNALNTQALKPFVVTQTGGENGGGSLITPEAKRFIDYHKGLRQRFMQFLQQESQLFSER